MAKSNSELALELTKSWVEKVGPATWYQVAEAYTGLYHVLNQATGVKDEEAQRAAYQASAISVLAQKGREGMADPGTLNQFEEELKRLAK